MIMSLFSKRVTLAGAVAGMVSGFLITVAWAIWLKESTGLYEMIPGFFGSLAVIWVVSRVSGKTVSLEETTV